MTPAERQQKRRKRLRKEMLATGRKAEAQRHQLKAAADYMPMPPGITYWRKVTVITPEGEREIWSPNTQPLAAIERNDGLGVLADTDIERLLTMIVREAARRGLPVPTASDLAVAPPTGAQTTAASLLQVAQARPLEAGECMAIGPAP